MNPIGEKYLRKSALPSIWCPGCGNGTVLSAALRAIDELEIIDRVGLVSGIGCAGWIPVYINADVMHTLHGRTLPFATGLKMSDPSRKIIVFSGDGDCLGIGGNHFIHACRRNLDITVIIFNNNIYGMTGGQYSPTTPMEKYASTAPYGNVENPFDLMRLSVNSGATFAARTTIFNYNQAVNLIQKGLSHKGMAVIEMVTNCHTYYGRYNGNPKPTMFLEYFKKNTVSLKKSAEMNSEELKGKIITGIFIDEERETYTQRYHNLIKKLSDK